MWPGRNIRAANVGSSTRDCAARPHDLGSILRSLPDVLNILMTGAQNQHYVPKFILRNFLGNREREQVHVFKKSTGKGFTTSIANIMAERRFHEFQIDDQYYASFEDAICRVEDMLLPSYKAVLEREALDGSPQEKADLLTFMAFQFTRTRAQRELFDRMEDQLAKHLGKSGASLEDIKGYVPRTEESRKIQHMHLIMKTTGKLLESLVEKDLMLLRAAPGRSFYLSDNPVCLHNDAPRKWFLGNLGFACEGIQVYLPLSADLMLCAWCPSLVGELRAKNADSKRQLAGAVLSKKMMNAKLSDEFQTMLDKMRLLRKPIEDRIRHCDNGTPVLLTTESMDFHNSMQVVSASEHIICKKADFDLAKRFMAENPHHNGLQISTN